MKNHKTSRLFGKLATAALLVLASPVAFGDTVTFQGGPYQSGNGGEFQAVITGTSLDAYISSYDQPGAPNSSVGTANIGGIKSFQTFCIEHWENISFNTPYTIDGVTDTAKLGGQNTSDRVSIGTAYLYSEFAKGTLLGYHFDGPNRQADAGALQNTIWWLENEQATAGTIADPGNQFSALVQTLFGTVGIQATGGGGTGIGAAADAWDSAFGTYGGAAGANNQTFGVYALNMGVGIQDQLIYQTPGNTQVPDGGATVLLLGMAMAGVGAVRRYFH